MIMRNEGGNCNTYPSKLRISGRAFSSTGHVVTFPPHVVLVFRPLNVLGVRTTEANLVASKEILSLKRNMSKYKHEREFCKNVQ